MCRVILVTYLALDSMFSYLKVFDMLWCSFVLSTAVYLVVAVLGFLMFGEETDSQITLNLPANAAVSTIALWMTVSTTLQVIVCPRGLLLFV